MTLRMGHGIAALEASHPLCSLEFLSKMLLICSQAKLFIVSNAVCIADVLSVTWRQIAQYIHRVPHAPSMAQSTNAASVEKLCTEARQWSCVQSFKYIDVL